VTFGKETRQIQPGPQYIKEEPQMRQGPDRPQLGSTTDQLEAEQHKGQDLHRAPH